MPESTERPDPDPAAEQTSGTRSAAVRGGGSGAAAGVTGDDADPAAPDGSWPDDTPPSRKGA
jgi:hypothetical protein